MACTLFHFSTMWCPQSQLVVNIAREYTEQLSSGKIIELLEAYNCYNGMYLYLGSRMAVSEVRVVVSCHLLGLRT